MEKKQKTYQATQSIQLDTYVLINGKAFLVEFRGGTLDPRISGRFQTSDPDVIAALDADIARVGPSCTFKCIHEEVLIEDETLTEGLEPKEIPGIKTVTATKSWLVEASEQGIIKKGITAGAIKNRTDVLRIAAENKVTFTELPTE